VTPAGSPERQWRLLCYLPLDRSFFDESRRYAARIAGLRFERGGVTPFYDA
jgi:hypothetical protein